MSMLSSICYPRLRKTVDALWPGLPGRATDASTHIYTYTALFLASVFRAKAT